MIVNIHLKNLLIENYSIPLKTSITCFKGVFRLRHRIFQKRGTPPPVGNILIITMIIFIVMIFLSIIIIDKGIKPTLMDIADQKTREFATRAINAAVRFSEDYDFEDMIEITTNNAGDVTTYGWNSAVVSHINRVSTD